MTSITEKMVAGGSCIARIDGKAVFIPFSLPGETVEIEIVDNRKDFAFASLKSVLQASAERVTPPCPLFGTCGGCSLQMASTAYQSTLRLSILKDVLARAHVEPAGPIEVESGAGLEYRSRFQFHRSGDGQIGIKAASSNRIIPVRDCPIAVPEIRQALQDGSLATSAGPLPAGERFHVFGYGGRLWREDTDTRCSIRMAGMDIAFDVRGFFQSNIPMLARLLSSMEDMTGRRLLDFYSGVGTFSMYAGRGFEDVVLVEHNREALSLAKENLSSRIRPPVYCAISDEKWASHPAARLDYDAAIVDPPRQGLHKGTLSWFARSGIPEIRYVSCDPVTFARDAAKLVTAGYSLEKVRLFDFYPQTHHIETLGIFKK